MKYRYFFLLLFPAFSPLFAQLEFAPAGAEWFYRNTSGYTTSAYSYSGFQYLSYTGDTLLGGRVCKRICSSIHAFQNNEPPYCSSVSTERYLYQKADSVFEYKTAGSTFLFRNNYAVGDTVETSANDALTVTSIDLLEFNGQPVRQFWLGDQLNAKRSTIYDRFGPEKGIFDAQLWYEVVDGGETRLRCYQDASFPQTNISLEPCDQVIQPASIAFTISLLPNPVHTELHIMTTGYLPDALPFTIYDATGRFILAGQLDSPSKSIPVYYFPPGMYWCVFRDGNSIFHQKFVKN